MSEAENEGGDSIMDLIRESGLDPRDYALVEEALASLRDDVVPSQAPAPSPELAAMLAGGRVTPLSPHRSRGAKIALVSGATVAAVMVGTGLAAAANVLPEPAQQVLSDFSDDHLPFHIPAPDERDGGTDGDDTENETGIQPRDEGVHPPGSNDVTSPGSGRPDVGTGKPSDPGQPSETPPTPRADPSPTAPSPIPQAEPSTPAATVRPAEPGAGAPSATPPTPGGPSDRDGGRPTATPTGRPSEPPTNEVGRRG